MDMVWVDPKQEPGDRDGGLFKGVFVGKNVVCFQPGLGLVFQIRERLFTGDTTRNPVAVAVTVLRCHRVIKIEVKFRLITVFCLKAV